MFSPPSERYLDIIIQGLEYYKVSPDYVAWLAKIPCKRRKSPDQFQRFDRQIVANSTSEDGFWFHRNAPILTEPTNELMVLRNRVYHWCGDQTLSTARKIAVEHLFGRNAALAFLRIVYEPRYELIEDPLEIPPDSEQMAWLEDYIIELTGQANWECIGQIENDQVDCLIIGGGLSGLFQANLIRQQFPTWSIAIMEEGNAIGGTWRWNSYPGSRCDIEGWDYCFHHRPTNLNDIDNLSAATPELPNFTERFPSQPEILSYIVDYSTHYELNNLVHFNRTVKRAQWRSNTGKWEVSITVGSQCNGRAPSSYSLHCKYLISAVGCLSTPKLIESNISGHSKFAGQILHTAKWAKETNGAEPKFDGKRVILIGTGSSGVQVATTLAPVVDRLFVVQRTPVYVVPLKNKPWTAKPEDSKAQPLNQEPSTAATQLASPTVVDWPQINSLRSHSIFGVSKQNPTLNLHSPHLSPFERRELFLQAWNTGGLAIYTAFADVFFSSDTNQWICEWIREQIYSIVEDSNTAKQLCPARSLPFGCRRTVVGNEYYQIFNRKNVELVNIGKFNENEVNEGRKEMKNAEDSTADCSAGGIERFEPTGLVVNGRLIEADFVIFATGFHAVTGTICSIDLIGESGQSLDAKWQSLGYPATYTGLMSSDFPNFFVLTGPGSPAILSNMISQIEYQSEFITKLLHFMADRGFHRVWTTKEAEEKWQKTIEDRGKSSLMNGCQSWYKGNWRALPLYHGCDAYCEFMNKLPDRQYEGFCFQ